MNPLSSCLKHPLQAQPRNLPCFGSECFSRRDPGSRHSWTTYSPRDQGRIVFLESSVSPPSSHGSGPLAPTAAPPAPSCVPSRPQTAAMPPPVRLLVQSTSISKALHLSSPKVAL